MWIQHLLPVRAWAIGRMLRLRHHAFQIALFHQLEQFLSVLFDVIRRKQVSSSVRQHAREQFLPLDQWQMPLVFSVQKQDVEGKVADVALAVQQIRERNRSSLVEADDLAVKDGVAGVHRVSDLRAQTIEPLEGAQLSRDQATLLLNDVREPAKAVILQLKDPVAMVKGLRPPL